MIVEALLAYAHLVAILTWTVFLASTTALARSDWLNPAAVDRLVAVDRTAMIGAVLVGATGLARWWFGIKGAGWMGMQPLLWIKLGLFAAMVAAAWRTRRQLRDWQQRLHATGSLPGAVEVDALRRRVFWASHLMLAVPLAAVLLARGLYTR